MSKYIVQLSLYFLVVFIGFPDAALKAQNSPESPAANLSWTTERLDEGIYWKSYKGDDLYDSRQSINVIELYLDSTDTVFKVAFVEDSTIKTSEFATANNALVAVNGSFFRRDTGGSTVFLKVNGEVIYQGSPNRNTVNESGGVGWSEHQPIQILKKPDDGWQSANAENILSSGPLLIYESKIQTFKNDPFHQNRHPRTAVAITNDKRLLLVTIDGRSFQSYGMTIPELAQFLQELGSENALNLDGGGSTSMWVKNMTENGIVNYPSDNLKFDHEGERDVANALLILETN